MAHQLPELPYAKNALEPHLSAEAIAIHYGKHHQAYVNKLNAMVEGTGKETMSLGDIIKSSTGSLFNQAAQVFNHTFYWHSMSPLGGGDPKGRLAEALSTRFGSINSFKEEFTQKAVSVFGSGWCWLVNNEEDQLEIVQTFNGGCPLASNQRPLLACDVWEHAYYVDYRHERSRYMEAFWAVVNWEFAAQNLQ